MKKIKITVKSIRKKKQIAKKIMKKNQVKKIKINGHLKENLKVGWKLIIVDNFRKILLIINLIDLIKDNFFFFSKCLNLIFYSISILFGILI